MTSPRKLILYNWLSSLLPDFGVFKRLRKTFLRWSGVVIPSSVDLCGTVRFSGCGEIIIGENSILRHACYLHVEKGGRIELGKKVMLGENVIIESWANHAGASSVTFGNNVDFMMGSLASANGNAHVRIGSNCKIAHNVSIKATEHQIDPNGECIGGKISFRNIAVSEGCWICAGAIIIPGVTVGRRNVIAAGAVVTQDTPPSVLVAGVPAVIKKQYQTNEVKKS
jgi:acetyltransferase-like isoleucine patch superfamily enzyme